MTVFLLLGLLTILVFGVLALFFGTTLYAGIIASPFLPTPKKYIRKALELSGLKPKEKFYDLGAGDGRALVIAAKEFGAQASGFELSYLLYLVSKINLSLNGVVRKAGVTWSNFYKEDLNKADVIFCWHNPRTFRKLEEKFNRELKQKTRIVTFSSPLLFWEPETTVELPKKGLKLFLYVKK